MDGSTRTYLTADYVAGFFDGEGCIHVGYGRGYLQKKISVSNIRPEVLDMIREHFGFGSVLYSGTPRWQVSDTLDIITCLEALLPYLVVKKQQVVLMLELCRLSNTKYSRPQLTEEQHVRQAELMAQISALNIKGRRSVQYD